MMHGLMGRLDVWQRVRQTGRQGREESQQGGAGPATAVRGVAEGRAGPPTETPQSAGTGKIMAIGVAPPRVSNSHLGRHGSRLR